MRLPFASPDSPGFRLNQFARDPLPVAIFYLVVVTLTESVTTILEPQLGLVVYGIILAALLAHGAWLWGQPISRLLLALAFAPLIRILSYAIPLIDFPQMYWYVLTAVPLLVAAGFLVPMLGYSRRSVGLCVGRLPVQLLIGLTGITFGVIEYQILAPAPMASSFTWQQIWLPALILFFATGLFEELIFRGIMQRAAVDALAGFGIWFVAIVFAILHIGYHSVVDLVFVFGVGLYFGWIVARTGSILGVTIAHGLTNIMLFLVMPFTALPALPVVALRTLPPPTVVVSQAIPVAANAFTSAGDPARLFFVGAGADGGQTKSRTSFDVQLHEYDMGGAGYRLAHDLKDLYDRHDCEAHAQRNDGEIENPAEILRPGSLTGAQHFLLDQQRQQDNNGHQA
jgi:uncharacterized protein